MGLTRFDGLRIVVEMSRDSAKGILDDLQPRSFSDLCKRLAESEVTSDMRQTLGWLSEVGEFDLFSKLMGMIPPQCAKKVFPDPKDGIDYMWKAAYCGVEKAPDDFYRLILRTVPGIHEYEDKDCSDRTLLHIACCDEGKLSDILRDRSLFSDVLELRLPDDKLREGGGDQNTPLHLAVQERGIRTSQLEQIMKMYPEMLKMEDAVKANPLQQMILEYRGHDFSERLQLLLKANPESAFIEGCEGWIPLQSLVESYRYAPLSDYRTLLEAYPRGAVHKTSTSTSSAICTMWDSWMRDQWEKSLSHRRRGKRPKFSATKWLSPPKEICLEVLEEIWSRIELMLLAATTGSTSKSIMLSSPSGRRWSAIDAIVDCSAACPWEMFLFAIAKHFGHPEKRDEDGRLPLHVIARASLFWSRDLIEGEDHKDLETNTPVQAILQASPSAARVLDFNGELPLHIAAKTPDFQSDQDADRESNIEALVATYKEGAALVDGKGRLPLHHAILARKRFDPDLECLLEAAPLTIDKADPTTRLLPFMLAAVGSNASLDSVYLLLQKDPVAVSSGVKEGEVEKYLLNKTANLASEVASLKARIAELEGNGGSIVTRSRKRKMTQNS